MTDPSALSIHTAADIESIRRSAAMAPLPRQQVDECLSGYLALARERERVVTLLGDLGPSWRAARSVLNELSELLRPPET